MRRELLAIATVLSTAVGAWAQDVEGGIDHPMIGRFEGARITAYDRRDFDEYQFPNAAMTSSESDSFLPIEGVKTSIAYVVPPTASLAEVARNYEMALTEAGFDSVFQCADDTCGGTSLAYAIEQFPLPRMIVDPFNYRYQGAKTTTETGEVYAAVLFSVDNDDQVRVQVTVVETDEIAFKMVDAAQMQTDVLETGRVALYGIQFDTDKATIRPDSAATLQEIATFLAGNPDLAVVIVGHTDNQGAMDYNLGLSNRRAEAVRAALVAEYGISSDRMSHAGAGFLAPVATNATEVGRALNRRVEIIAR